MFTADTLVQAGARVSTGEYCQIDYGTLLADGSYRFRRLLEPAVEADALEHRPLTVGDRVTITTKCTVIADVGSGSLVGANSVVAEPLPEHVLAAGSPARVIGYYAPGATVTAEP